MRHTEKLNALGQLAGGVAHDFNNQLAGIMGFAELLAAQLRDQTHRDYAQAIVTAAMRSADLTHKMLAFARKGPQLRVPVDVHALIREAHAILTRSIDPRIRIEVQLVEAAAMVRGDPSQLQNALLNLCINARDAMAGGGVLRIATALGTLPSSRPGDQPGGPCLRITIADTGCGMDASVKAHLFEPFFTTKEQGKGTGMGLAAVYGTVNAHGGSVSVDSEVGTGTTMTILLPLAVGVEAGAAVSAAAKPAAAGLRLLVVDDEPAIREMLTQMLTAGGHHVQSAADGGEAVRLYRDHWPTIDVVLLDLLMPVMGGLDTFRALKAINPRVRALLASGVSLEGEAQALVAQDAIGFLQKPFQRAELFQALDREGARIGSRRLRASAT